MIRRKDTPSESRKVTSKLAQPSHRRHVNGPRARRSPYPPSHMPTTVYWHTFPLIMASSYLSPTHQDTDSPPPKIRHTLSVSSSRARDEDKYLPGPPRALPYVPRRRASRRLASLLFFSSLGDFGAPLHECARSGAFLVFPFRLHHDSWPEPSGRFRPSGYKRTRTQSTGALSLSLSLRVCLFPCQQSTQQGERKSRSSFGLPRGSPGLARAPCRTAGLVHEGVRCVWRLRCSPGAANRHRRQPGGTTTTPRWFPSPQAGPLDT